MEFFVHIVTDTGNPEFALSLSPRIFVKLPLFPEIDQAETQAIIRKVLDEFSIYGEQDHFLVHPVKMEVIIVWAFYQPAVKAFTNEHRDDLLRAQMFLLKAGAREIQNEKFFEGFEGSNLGT